METLQLSFRQVYYGLSTDPRNNQQLKLRDAIMFKCGITKNTFYNWVNERHRVPVSAQTIIRTEAAYFVGKETAKRMEFIVIKEEVSYGE